MLCVRAPAFEERLIFLCEQTGNTKSYYVRLALQILFDEMDKFLDFEAIEFSDEPPLDFSLVHTPSQLTMPKTNRQK